jgi:hypothetical protein
MAVIGIVELRIMTTALHVVIHRMMVNITYIAIIDGKVSEEASRDRGGPVSSDGFGPPV